MNVAGMCHQYDKQPIKPISQNHSQEAKSSTGTRDTFCLLWNLQVHHYVHKNTPVDTFLSQFHPINVPKHQLISSSAKNRHPTRPRL